MKKSIERSIERARKMRPGLLTLAKEALQQGDEVRARKLAIQGLRANVASQDTIMKYQKILNT